MKSNPKKLLPEQHKNLLAVLKVRFDNNMNRHKAIDWFKLLEKLEINDEQVWSLNEMEITGGEPDVVGYDPETDEYIFFDCSIESPSGRRSICYDRKALDSRKKYKPKNNALDMAKDMGIKILTEQQYQYLQQLGNFDTKTSSWIFTPDKIRDLGGALFADFRFDTVFTYHNGAESYYSARGFRGSKRI